MGEVPFHPSGHGLALLCRGQEGAALRRLPPPLPHDGRFEEEDASCLVDANEELPGRTLTIVPHPGALFRTPHHHRARESSIKTGHRKIWKHEVLSMKVHWVRSQVCRRRRW